MVRVAENAGAVVTHFEGVSEKVDALSVSRRRPLIVMSTSKGSGCRSRFDIGHEIGHLVIRELRPEITTPSLKRTILPLLSYFHAVLLLSNFQGQKLNWTTLYQLKLKYKISVAAILYRAHHHLFDRCNTISCCTNLFIQKHAEKIEKYDEAVAMEQPELLENAFQALLEEEEINAEYFASQVGINPNLLEKLTGVLSHKKPTTKTGKRL